MSKIRINELARQLEVKSREVIDKLHELGIAEKVTHSSSIDEDKADQLRRYYSGESHAPLPSASHRNGTAVHEPEHVTDEAPREAARPPVRQEGARQESAERRPRLTQQPPPGAGVEEPEAPARPAPETAPKPAAAEAPVPEAAAQATPATAPAPPPADAEKTDDDLKPRALPLRPPVLGRGSPIHPPVGAPRIPLTPRPVPPLGEPRVGEPRIVEARPPQSSNLAPGRPVPPAARPIPSGAPRPGQVLSGPRAPMPSNLAPRTQSPGGPPQQSAGS